MNVNECNIFLYDGIQWRKFAPYAFLAALNKNAKKGDRQEGLTSTAIPLFDLACQNNEMERPSYECWIKDLIHLWRKCTACDSDHEEKSVL